MEGTTNYAWDTWYDDDSLSCLWIYDKNDDGRTTAVAFYNERANGLNELLMNISDDKEQEYLQYLAEGNEFDDPDFDGFSMIEWLDIVI
jgi:hypothetical protein